MPIIKIHSSYRGMKRLKQIASVFIHHGFYDLVSRTNIPGISQNISKREKLDETEGEPLSSAQRTRMVFEELGPSFIKLGQMLSLEPDIIPPDYIEEFKKLQDSTSPFPFEEVSRIIEDELGKKPEEIFSSLDKQPIAAASMAQVHFGKLFTGEEVAVKVQRPRIEIIIREDIKILKKIARFMVNNVKDVDLLNPVAVVEEFESFITKEMDFTNEAANIERFANNLRNNKKICIPKVYWEVSSSRVLVMEHLHGLAMDEVEKMLEAGLVPAELAHIGLDCFAQQILEHGIFHADPHPGNSLAMLDGRIGLIDFGIIGFIDRELMRHLANIFIGYAEHDYDRLIIVFQSMGLLSDDIDLKNFKYDLIELSEPFYGRSMDNIQVKDVFDRVLSISIKYRLRLPRELILLLKSLVAMEAIGRKLSPDANILETMKPYALRLLERTHDPKVMMKDLRHDLFNIASLFRTSPDLVHQLVKSLAQGDLNINLNHRIDQLEELEQSYLRGINRLATGVVVGTAVLAGSWILVSDNHLIPINIPSLGIENFPLTILLGLIGYSVATILGIWLAYNMFFRSK